MTRIGIILGSTRPGRNGKAVADWVLEHAATRTDAEFELVDLADHPLPHLDEPASAKLRQYQNEHTKRWSATIDAFDGFVIVTPEYNHSTSGVLKNATTCTTSGTTRPSGSSPTASPAGCGPSSTCAWWRASFSSPTWATRSASR